MCPADGPESDPPTEEDLLIKIRLSNRSMGFAEERLDLESLGQELEDAVLAAGTGEFDGEEIGGGECTFFFAGPSAERLLAVIQPILHRHRLGRGATAVLQVGGGDPTVRQV